MIKFEDFKENEKSYTLIKNVGNSGLRIYFGQEKGKDTFKVSAYANGFKEKHICYGISLEECNLLWKEICEKFVFLQPFVDEVDLEQFVDSLREKHKPHTRYSRFREISDDGVIECFVKKDGDDWIARVKDFKKGTIEKTECNICPPFATEEEANEQCRSTLNEYNLTNSYPTVRKRNRGVELEHERPVTPSESMNEFFVCGNGKRTDLSEVQYNAIINILNMGE